MRGVHLKRKLKYTEKVGVVAAGYYITIDMQGNIIASECYNRDVLVHNVEN